MQGITDNLDIAVDHSMETMPEGGEQAAPTVDSLIAALKASQDDATRRTIASALGRVGEKAVPAVEPLTTALNAAHDESTRETIADAINQIAAAYHNSLHESKAQPDRNFLENFKAAETAADLRGWPEQRLGFRGSVRVRVDSSRKMSALG